jgi:hypothetical protein
VSKVFKVKADTERMKSLFLHCASYLTLLAFCLETRRHADEQRKPKAIHQRRMSHQKDVLARCLKVRSGVLPSLRASLRCEQSENRINQQHIFLILRIRTPYNLLLTRCSCLLSERNRDCSLKAIFVCVNSVMRRSKSNYQYFSTIITVLCAPTSQIANSL